MDELRNNKGFIDLEKLNITFKFYNIKVRTFYYNGKKYYFKNSDRTLIPAYKELIAEELAEDYGIPHVHYDLACTTYDNGVISEDFIKDYEYMPIAKLLDKDMNYYNNLMDIWEVLESKYNDEKVVEKLVNQLINVFIFDELLGNGDRNVFNCGILSKGNDINIAPIFDNERILDKDMLDKDEPKLKLDKSYADNLEMFLKYSSNDYVELFKSKLWIISEENIESAIKRVEKRIKSKIDPKIVQVIKENFNILRNRINNTLENYNNTIVRGKL